MDSASRQLIQQMLAEDELHRTLAGEQALGEDEDEELDISNDRDNNNGNDNNDEDGDEYIEEKDEESTGKSKGAARQRAASTSTKADTSTHGSRWTEEEDAQLLEGIKRFGHGKWKEVSRFMGTRSSLQVKNRARHLFVHRGLEMPPTDVNAIGKSGEPVAPQTASPGNAGRKVPDAALAEEAPLSITAVADDVPQEDERMADGAASPPPASNATATEQANAEDSKEEKEEAVPPSDGVIIDRNAISADEVRGNPEFFCGKPACTPERYMKIRNHILDCWEKIRPGYLTKTGARRDLRDGGDVNVIGRVHGYLEQVGAINVNCDFTVKRRPAPRPRTVQTFESDSDYRSNARPTAFNVFNEIVEGNDVTWPGTRKRMRTAPRSRDFYDQDPFMLVPLQPFDEESAPPFSVHVVPSAMTIMDLHAHLLRTEVIGLLGGKFDPATKQIDILTAFPCRGASTDFQIAVMMKKKAAIHCMVIIAQCEMDPESEIMARMEFAERGLAVVGWYHSHPTFEPTPSIRDIENQVNYQTLFRHDNGQEPFVGVIVNPYDRDRMTNQSKMRFFMVGPDYADGARYRVPYRLVETEAPEQWAESRIEQLAAQVDKLMDDFGEHTQRMMFEDTYRSDGELTVRDKLLESVGSWLDEDSAVRREILERISNKLSSATYTAPVQHPMDIADATAPMQITSTTTTTSTDEADGAVAADEGGDADDDRKHMVESNDDHAQVAATTTTTTTMTT
ncbi:hypothetical protein SYNPS1DRAFT_29488 [Syncephalis pseudoplumigaleata]|uniref:Uncharacterized protein n=1 Tax=Syncephalis pseudoplumigaleata TaxID=1712513 RepID=A0A4P9YZD0_9FUNG|nr:hypothetical protein SYNPS1DRAFT_29488 [Syncephalis pseudoplumigaleata]|eukprot:RKP24761.1 hypothetical protein SYNPS1DRAFT_29488 [Syncephalis pseudoplumigaleata]